MVNINGYEYDPEFIRYIYSVNKFKMCRGSRIILFHILAIVDGDQFVVKWYSFVKKRWNYEILWLFGLYLHWPVFFYEKEI